MISSSFSNWFSGITVILLVLCNIQGTTPISIMQNQIISASTIQSNIVAITASPKHGSTSMHSFPSTWSSPHDASVSNNTFKDIHMRQHHQYRQVFLWTILSKKNQHAYIWDQSYLLSIWLIEGFPLANIFISIEAHQIFSIDSIFAALHDWNAFVKN